MVADGDKSCSLKVFANNPNCYVAKDLSNGTHTTVICNLPAQIGLTPYLTPTVALLSLIVTAIIALRALHNTRSVARQRATLDLIEKRESTDHYRSISRTFFELQKGPGFMHLVDPSDGDKIVRKSVFDYLNHYEIIAIGIRQGILDERIYRAWMQGAFVRDWNAAADFVQRQRWKNSDHRGWEYSGSIYDNYQHVACKWSAEARVIDSNSSKPPDQKSGPGDDPLPTPVDEVKLDD